MVDNDANKKYLMNRAVILKKLDRIDELLTLPAIAMEVNGMLRDYNVSTKRLSDTIEKDQAIVSKILRLVNSAFFGFQSKINSIPHALMVLGFNSVRNAVMSISVIDALSMKNIPKGFDIREFWKHSIAVAVTSKRIAEKTRLYIPGDCFIGGLLHDIGKVILAQFFGDILIEILKLSHGEGRSFSSAEKEIIPIGHDQIGGYLAKQWHLTPDMVDAIRYHHSKAVRIYNIELLVVVHTADYIVNHFNPDFDQMIMTPELRKDAEDLMKKQLDTVNEWFPEVSDEIETACDFFLCEIRK
jgi:putative nucleotidyltransferase with HDIG domain